MTFSQKLVQFVTHHWLMVGAFVALLILLLVEEARSKGLGNRVTVSELVDLMNRKEALVIDIRDADSFANGHIANSRNIPNDQISKDSRKLEALKQKQLVIVCYKGVSSLTLTNSLRKRGFNEVKSLAGGIQAWQEAQMPIKKGK